MTYWFLNDPCYQGGIACTVVGYPLDTLKTRLQMGAQFSELVKTLSVRNLFSGIAAPIYGAMPCWAAGYFGYSFGKHLAWSWYPENKNDSPSSRISASELILGGITSGILASFVRCPADVVKVKCQVEGLFVCLVWYFRILANTKLFTVAHIVAQPPLHMCTVVQFLGRKTATVLRELLSSSRGAYSLVRGLMPTLVHTIPASTIFFGSYDIFHNEIFKNYEGVSSNKIFQFCRYWLYFGPQPYAFRFYDALM